MTIGFIGGGVMAEAFIQSFLAAGIDPKSITVADPLVIRRDRLARLGVNVTDDNRVASRASIVILAVKPQQLDDVQLALERDAILLSIVAGAKLESFGHTHVVRAMPNTPARIGAGATVWTSKGLSETQRAVVTTLLSSTGLAREVQTEAEVEMATGLSGPMPAFLFLVLETFVDAGEKLGLSRELSLELSLQTLAGSVELVRRSGEAPSSLREQVTSKGGATAAGLAVLKEGRFVESLADAVHAVYARALELGRR